MRTLVLCGILTLFVSCHRDSHLVLVGSLADIPTYGERFPDGTARNITYFNGGTPRSMLVRFESDKYYYEALNKKFCRSTGYVTHEEFFRIPQGYPKELAIEGTSVSVFEGDPRGEREHSTFYFVANKNDDRESRKQGMIVVHFE